MITYNDARQIALSKASQTFDLSKQSDEVVLYDENTVERDIGWVFYYNSKGFRESGDFRKMLMGNAPIFVSKMTGESFFIQDTVPVDDALASLKSRKIV